MWCCRASSTSLFTDLPQNSSISRFVCTNAPGAPCSQLFSKTFRFGHDIFDGNNPVNQTHFASALGVDQIPNPKIIREYRAPAIAGAEMS